MDVLEGGVEVKEKAKTAIGVLCIVIFFATFAGVALIQIWRGVREMDKKYSEISSGHLKAAYVRDKSYGCFLTYTNPPDKILRSDGSVAMVGGFKKYECADGVNVIIHQDEEQP